VQTRLDKLKGAQPPGGEARADSAAGEQRRSLAGPDRRSSALGSFWRSFRHNVGGVAGLAIMLCLVVGAVIGPGLTAYGPAEMIMTSPLAPPSASHPFGTDQFGRDVFSRIIHGAHLSLSIGLISVGIGVLLGGVLGLLAGYAGPWVDNVVMRLIDVQLAFPSILLAMGIVSVLGPSLQNAMIAVGFSSIPSYARVMRGSVLSTKELTYVEAARCVGSRHVQIMLRHILPNVIAPMIVLASLGMASAILTASGLSFIGLGAQPPTPEWGAILNDGRQYFSKAWWITTFPGVAIMLAVLAMNLIGDGLRDALDPRLRDQR
jgi:peptide/nickel transport system permease protein